MMPSSPAPPSLPTHVFAIMLQYLLPPSPPVPRHLLSAALLQRHYFLSIDHDDNPASYFLLPKEEPDLAYGIVLALEQIATYDVDHAIEEIEYLVDGDDRLLARVALMGQLQVVFVLESRAGEPQLAGEGDSTGAVTQVDSTEWRYTDVIWRAKERRAGHATVELALASQAAAATVEPVEGEEDVPAEQTADEFWDGWDEPGEQHGDGVRAAQATEPESEDQYYARYADVETVAGTALTEDDVITTPEPRRSRDRDGPPSTRTKEEAVQSIIRGAYQLWRGGGEVAMVEREEERKRAFRSLVQACVAGL